ncbi:MAG TPA: serine hydrolase [Chloroflexia bacterium]|nr:serine hydrolase [Chloroflexia bacterium]
MFRVFQARRRAFALSAALLLVAVSLLTYRERPVQAQQAPVWMLYGSAPDAPDSDLQAIVDDVATRYPGVWGIVVKKLATGQYAAYNGDVQQVSASLYKLWVLAELYRQVSTGSLSMASSVTVSSSDAYYDAVLGVVRVAPGSAITLQKAAELMIQLSDNTTAALLVRILGPDNINRFMQQNGLRSSVLNWSGSGDNLTTPLDVLRELEMMATSQMVNAESSRAMVDMMLGQQINNRLPQGLPPGARIAHKTGDLGSLLHDVGIVYGPSGPYVIVVMASQLRSYGHSYDVTADLAATTYEYFNSVPSSPARYFPETRQTVGHDFLKIWNEYGGLNAFGFPIGPEQVRGGLLVQQFERARMELHPELGSAGGPQPAVGLGLLGLERSQQLGLSWGRSPNSGQGHYFEATGQEVSGDFLAYWENHGGERLFGLPISPAADMVSPADGKTYRTQWFERARMEYHPELPEGERVVLGLLGAEMAVSR